MTFEGYIDICHGSCHKWVVHGEVENSEFSENSENQFSEVFKGTLIKLELSILHHTETENSDLKTWEFCLRHYDQLTPTFSNSELSILHYPQTENSELKTSEFSLRFTRTTMFFN